MACYHDQHAATIAVAPRRRCREGHRCKALPGFSGLARGARQDHPGGRLLRNQEEGFQQATWPVGHSQSEAYAFMFKDTFSMTSMGFMFIEASAFNEPIGH